MAAANTNHPDIYGYSRLRGDRMVLNPDTGAAEALAVWRNSELDLARLAFLQVADEHAKSGLWERLCVMHTFSLMDLAWESYIGEIEAPENPLAAAFGIPAFPAATAMF